MFLLTLLLGVLLVQAVVAGTLGLWLLFRYVRAVRARIVYQERYIPIESPQDLRNLDAQIHALDLGDRSQPIQDRWDDGDLS